MSRPAARRRDIDARAGLICTAAMIYLAATAAAMQLVSYDIWGALVAIPFIVLLLVFAVQRTLTGEWARLRRAAYVGIVAKIAATFARYWIAVDAYGGASDSTEYHRVGRIIAGEVHRGDISILQLAPHTVGTRAVGEITGVIYSIVGSSKLAGFFCFAAFGYLGVLWTVKAACIGVPGLASTRYAWLCFLMPSIVFWPSSIGKEACMFAFLGAICLGAARIFRGEPVTRPLFVLAAGGCGAVLVRPHLAAIWIGALVLCLLWSVASGRVESIRGHRRVALAFLTFVALASMAVIARVALDLLINDPTDESVSSQVNDIFDLTVSRSSGGGSELETVTTSSPLDYPWAVIRTLTRPMLNEATNLASLLPSLETTFILIVMAVSWRRLLSLPRELLRTPYVLYALLVCIMVGLAFSNFANLGLLVRQRSLVLPSLLLLPCMPIWRPADHAAALPIGHARVAAR
ncbi:MAG: hypothetical protein ABMA25_02815 [Ilumatobacteraceae bacterium]